MSKEELYERINEVFQDVFDDENLVVNENTTAKDVEGWDSLIHITLLTGMEDEFEIEFNMKEIVSLKKVGDMAALIEKLCAEK